MENEKKYHRTQKDPPTKAAHLNSKPALRAQNTLEKRFHQTSTSIAPAANVASHNWTERNNILFVVDGTGNRDRCHGGGNLRNTTRDITTSLKITTHVAHGDETQITNLMRQIMATGRYDHIAEERIRDRDNGRAIDDNITMNVIGSEAERSAINNETTESREGTGSARTSDGLVNDPHNSSIVRTTARIADMENLFK